MQAMKLSNIIGSTHFIISGFPLGFPDYRTSIFEPENEYTYIYLFVQMFRFDPVF